MRWFVLITGVTLIGGLTIAGYATMIWLAQLTGPQPTAVQVELLQTARWLTQNGAIMLGRSFSGGWPGRCDNL